MFLTAVRHEVNSIERSVVVKEVFFKFSNINEVLSGEQEKESIIRVRVG